MSQVSNMLRVVRPHIPLIKFRKGGRNTMNEGFSPTSILSSAPEVPLPPPTQNKKLRSGPVLEEWEVPMKFRRTPMTEEEMEFINRGGPA